MTGKENGVFVNGYDSSLADIKDKIYTHNLLGRD